MPKRGKYGDWKNAAISNVEFVQTDRSYSYIVLALVNTLYNQLQKSVIILWSYYLDNGSLSDFAQRVLLLNSPPCNSLEVLYDFSLHTVPNIPLEYLFDLFPLIKPRSFSIASSLKYLPNKLQLLVAVVHYRSKMVESRLGLCSNFLANCLIGDKVPIWTKKGEYRKPSNNIIPLIMSAPLIFDQKSIKYL